ncbi:hypothetical protein AB0F77_33085 [Streptomyces sp. NPDC026672]|uniref:SCO2400 family protein n=1 Tax=unclassified Streptomyces TaxID=2593676 RepID=UPI0033CC35D9
MDYCSSCRRHLNGALVCPGCGAYAPDIAPRIAPAPSAHAPVRWEPAAAPAVREPAVPPAGTATWHDDGPTPYAAAPGEARPETHDPADAYPDVDAEDASAVGTGRAARRRQLARWKKNQRRAVVATAVALVGGGLTVASMDRGSGHRAQATSAPDNRSMGGAEDAAPDAAPGPVFASPATPAAGRPGHEAPGDRTTAPGVPHQRTVSPGQAAGQPGGVPLTGTRPDGAVTPFPARSTVPHQQSATPPPAAQDPTQSTPSAPPQQSDNTPPPSGGTDPGTPQTTPPPASTDPAQLCVLVLCL